MCPSRIVTGNEFWKAARENVVCIPGLTPRFFRSVSAKRCGNVMETVCLEADTGSLNEACVTVGVQSLDPILKRRNFAGASGVFAEYG